MTTDAHARLVADFPSLVYACAVNALAEVGDVPLGAEGRDIAFRFCELLCGSLSFLRDEAERQTDAHARLAAVAQAAIEWHEARTAHYEDKRSMQLALRYGTACGKLDVAVAALPPDERAAIIGEAR